MLAIPIARIADRGDRGLVLAAGLALWSLATAACGFAQNFTQMFLARMSVGIGEAAGVAPAYSLMSDLFPPERRARAMALFSLGIPIGSAIGIVGGGLVASRLDWRAAFIALGLAGLLFAPIYRRGVRDPRRGQPAEVVAVSAVLGVLARKPSFWLMSLAAGIGSLVAYGLAFWIPSFFARSFHLDLVDRAVIFGAVQLFGGAAGIWLGGLIGDRLQRSRPAAFALVPTVTYALCLPTYLLAIASKSVTVAALLLVIPTALSVAWLGPVVAAITAMVPPRMRSTASAMFLFTVNLIGLGLGTLVIGSISDALTARYGDEALRYSAMATTTLYLGAALLMGCAALRLAHDASHLSE